MMFTFFTFLFPLSHIGLIGPMSITSSVLFSQNENTVSPTEYTPNFETCASLTSIEETDSSESSPDPCWWLDSGGTITVTDGIASTISGALDAHSSWRAAYAHSNPIDTDYGLHPQNIFRLISKKKWQDSTQELIFMIKNYNVSTSQNRNQSNGVLLMSHYINSNNLYYAGLRVDGTAVIKKKINGIYVTLAQTQYDVSGNYSATNPILLPIDTWIGERFTTQNNPDGSITLQFYANMSPETNNSAWKLLVSAVDSSNVSGSPPIQNYGNVGIRTDFMDAEFKSYHVAIP